MSEERQHLLKELLKEAAENGCLQGKDLRVSVDDGTTVVVFLFKPCVEPSYTYESFGGWPPGC